MKKALVGYQGWVTEIVEPGQDFEIYEGDDANMAWVDAPDEITLDWTLEWSPSQGQMIWIERDAPFTNNAVARKVAYGQVEEQLDMIWHEIDETGGLSKNGAWYQHIAAIKEIVPPPPPPEEPVTLEELQARAANTEPSEDKPNIPSTQEVPAWKRYPGWKGYQPS